MRNAKLAAVLLLALTGGASAVLNATECGLISDRTFIDDCSASAVAETCNSYNTMVATSDNYAAVTTALTSACAASSNCDIQSNTTFAGDTNDDGTITLQTLNTCNGADPCAPHTTWGHLDDCVQNGFLNNDGTKSAAVATVSASAFVFACVSAAVAAFA